MLLNTYTAKGRAAARTLSTSFLRDEMRIVAGTHGRVTLTTARGKLTHICPIRVCRWLVRFAVPMPTAPDSAALLADDEIFYMELRTVGGGFGPSAFYKEDAWPVFRALISHHQADIRRRKREIARIKKEARRAEIELFLIRHEQQLAEQKGGPQA